MALFRRDLTPQPHHLGTGSTLSIASLDSRPVSTLTWTRQERAVFDERRPAVDFLRRADVCGRAHLTSRADGGALDARVDLAGGGSLGVILEPGGDGFRLVPREATGAGQATEPIEYDYVPSGERGELVFAMSSLVAQSEKLDVELPAPLSVTAANLQITPGNSHPANRLFACVFVTRAHDVPPGAGQDARDALWVRNTVGIKLRLDGTIMADPHDDDPHGDRSRHGLATARQWAGGQVVDVVGYARALAARTQYQLGTPILGV